MEPRDGQDALTHRKHRIAQVALNKEAPLVRRRVPVQLAHRTRLEHDLRGGEVLRGLESRGVDRLDLSAGELLIRLLGPVEDVGVRDLALRALRRDGLVGGGLMREDVELLRRCL